MKIAIDGREIKEGGAGKGRYVKELIVSLAKLDSENQYYIYVWEKPNFVLPKNFSFVKLPKIIPRFLWLGFDMLRRKIDLFFSPTGYHPVLFSPVSSVLVVHDLAVFVEPRAHPALKTKLIEKTALPLALRRAAHIIAVSQNTKSDLVRCFRVKPDKISVTPLASFAKPSKSTPVKLIKTKFKLPSRIVLFVGTIEPRKNVINLIRAYNKLPIALKLNTALVLAGKRGWNESEIVREIQSAPKDSRILEIGYLSDQDLAALYSLATVFVYPSWYEGFGLPVLEAMQYGVPVITSNTSSLPEVTEDAAILVDPGNIAEISQAIEKMITSPDLIEKYSKKGLAHAARFNWQDTAKKTLEVFQKTAKRGNI